MSADIERYEALLALMPIGCLLLEDGVIKRANPEAVETLGIPVERLLGVPLIELLVPEDEESCQELLEPAAREEADPTGPDAGEGTAGRRAVRLVRGLAPVELSTRAIDGGIVLIGVRSMANEYHYSAQAGGALTHDIVTGFPDHYHVLSQLDERLRNPNRKPMAILGIWVDDLPSVAQNHGMRAAHRVMRETGLRLQDRLRGPDLLGRFREGGFLVLMSSDSTAEQLGEIADRLRDEVAFPVELDSGLSSFTASVVIGTIKNQKVTVERILALLDAAANRALNSRGNRTDFLSL